MKKYTLRKGTRVSGDPKIIGCELEAIRKRNGGKLYPADVIKESRPKAAPLHDEFEWDNSTAADEYRLYQARHLIKCVRVIHGDDKEPVSQFVNVRMNPIGESYYQDIRMVARNADEYEKAMAGAIDQLIGAQRTVEELREYAKKYKRKDVKGIGTALNGVVSATQRLQKIQEDAVT